MTADGRRLDDSVGYAFCLLLKPELLDQVSGDLRQKLRDLDVVVLEDRDIDYLDQLSAKAVLLRPDRYILGVANDMSELQSLVSDLPLR